MVYISDEIIESARSRICFQKGEIDRSFIRVPIRFLIYSYPSFVCLGTPSTSMLKLLLTAVTMLSFHCCVHSTLQFINAPCDMTVVCLNF
uniref:Uncharacterized protein n=1 Tax=Lepeophtheirus salmonis TaxID=72036 RepID=A0A0K2TCW4_LEPSM